MSCRVSIVLASFLLLWANACVEYEVAVRLRNGFDAPLSIQLNSRNLKGAKPDSDLYFLDSGSALDIRMEKFVGEMRTFDGTTVRDYRFSNDLAFELSKRFSETRKPDDPGYPRVFAEFIPNGEIRIGPIGKSEPVVIAPVAENSLAPEVEIVDTCWTEEIASTNPVVGIRDPMQPGLGCVASGALLYPFVTFIGCPLELYSSGGGWLVLTPPYLMQDEGREHEFTALSREIYGDSLYEACKWFWFNLGGERQRVPTGRGLPLLTPEPAAKAPVTDAPPEPAPADATPEEPPPAEPPAE